jgi:hypothetical protein
VQHDATLPNVNRVYRCSVCRLQMTFDPIDKKMRPLPPNDHDNHQKNRNAA